MSESEDEQYEFTVEKVLRHATVGYLRKQGHLPDGHWSRRNNELLFRIRWEGYSTDEESLEPEGSLEHIDKFQEYKKSHGIVTKRIPSNDPETADTFEFVSEKSPSPRMVPKIEPKAKRGRKPGTPNRRGGAARGGRASRGSRASSAAGSSVAGSAKSTPKKKKCVIATSESESEDETRPRCSSPAKAKKPAKKKNKPSTKRPISSDDSESASATIAASLSPGGSLQLEDGWAKIIKHAEPVATSDQLQQRLPSKAPAGKRSVEEEPTASTSKHKEPAARKKSAIGAAAQQMVAEIFDESPASPQDTAAAGRKKTGAKVKNKAAPPTKSEESKKAKDDPISRKRPKPESPTDGSDAKKLATNFRIPKKPKLDAPQGPIGSSAAKQQNATLDFRSPIDNPAPKPSVHLAPPVERPPVKMPPSFIPRRDLVKVPAAENFSSRPLADKSAEQLQPRWKRFNNVPVLSPPSGQEPPSPPTSGATEAASTEPKQQVDEPPATDTSEQSLSSGSAESLPPDTWPASVESKATAVELEQAPPLTQLFSQSKDGSLPPAASTLAVSPEVPNELISDRMTGGQPPTMRDEEPDSSHEPPTSADESQSDAQTVPPQQAACVQVASTTHCPEPTFDRGTKQSFASSSEIPVPLPCDPRRAAKELRYAPKPERIAEKATETSAEKEQPVQGTSNAQVEKAEPPLAPESPATFGKIAQLWNLPLQLPPPAVVPETPPPMAQKNSALADALAALGAPTVAFKGRVNSKPESPSKNPFANWLKTVTAESPRAKKAMESKMRSAETSKTTTESTTRATASSTGATRSMKRRADSLPRAPMSSAVLAQLFKPDRKVDRKVDGEVSLEPTKEQASALQRLKGALSQMKATKPSVTVQAPLDAPKARDRKRKVDAGQQPSTSTRRSRYVPPRNLPPQRSVIVRDVDDPLQCVVIRSRRQLDWESASAYIERVAESSDYLEDESDEPVVFAKCSSKQCAVMEKDLFCKELPPDTSMPIADRSRRRHNSETLADGYASRLKPMETAPQTPPSIKELREFAEDVHDGHLTANRLKRAFDSLDVFTVGRILDECVSRRIPMSRQYVADLVVGRWLTRGDGRTTMAELFRAKAVDRSLCGVVEHDVCSFLGAMWQMLRAETQKTLLHRFDTDTEPFVLRCLSTAAPCQLEFAVRMGLPLGARSETDPSPLELALQRGHSNVAWDLIRLGADCAAEVARKSQMKEHPVLAGHLHSLRRFVLFYLAHPELGLASLMHFPVRPLSDVHLCGLPPFPGASSEFIVNITSAEAGQELKTVLVIFAAKLVPKKNAEGFKPVLHPLCANEELKSTPHVPSVRAQSEDGTSSTDLAFVAAKHRQMWLFEWPKDSPIGSDLVRLHLSMDRNARYEPDVLFLAQIWHVAHFNPQAAINF